MKRMDVGRRRLHLDTHVCVQLSIDSSSLRFVIDREAIRRRSIRNIGLPSKSLYVRVSPRPSGCSWYPRKAKMSYGVSFERKFILH